MADGEASGNASRGGAAKARPRGLPWLALAWLVGSAASLAIALGYNYTPLPAIEGQSTMGGAGIYAARALFAALGIAAFLAGCRELARLTSTLHHGESEPASEKSQTNLIKAVARLQDRIDAEPSEHNSPDAAWDLVEQLVRPSTFRRRVSEAITFNADHLIREAVIEIDRPNRREPAVVPAAHEKAAVISMDTDTGRASNLLASIESERREQPSRRLIPVMKFKRGYLVDNFSLRNHAGDTVPTMTHAQTIVLLGRCTQVLLDMATDSDKINASPEKRGDYQFVEMSLLAHCVEADLSLDADQVQKLVRDKLPVGDDHALDLLAHLVATLAHSYVIIAEVGASYDAGRVDLLRYRFTEPLTRQTTSPTSRRAKLAAAARKSLALDPAQVLIDASRARRCQSYHLTVHAPTGHHVDEVHFIKRGEHTRIHHVAPRDLENDEKAYFRCPNPKGQSFAHLYTRHFEKSAVSDPGLLVSWQEDLPGSLGKAWLMAATTLGVIWLLGVSWFSSDLAPGRGNETVGTIDPGALLFAVPLAVWGLIGYGDRRQVNVSSVFPRVSVILSLGLGLVAVMAKLFIDSGRVGVLPEWPSMVFITNPLWIVLTVLALINMGLVGARLITRLWARGNTYGTGG